MPRIDRKTQSIVCSVGLLLTSIEWASAALQAADCLTPIPLGQVRVEGEIGRRVDVTIHNNLLVLDVDGDFLKPFRERSRKAGYIGLGKLIDAAVRLAAYSGASDVIRRKNHLVNAVIELQEPDGYVGMLAPSARITSLWDIHEMSYIIYGLLTEARLFQNERARQAARKAADYIVRRWSDVPENWGQRTGVATNVAVTSLERTLITLAQQTGDRRYIDFCLKERGLADWNLGIVIGRRPGDLTRLLTEFPDPGGRAVYFRVPDLSVAVDDELLSGP